MSQYHITLNSGRKLVVPDDTTQSILKSAEAYPTPLWDYRIEKVLKLSKSQWILPHTIAEAKTQLINAPYGIHCLAWKLFNRGYHEQADIYLNDVATYQDYPRHFGRHIVPLVDEDAANQHIGWARIDGCTKADHNHAVFIEWTLVDLFSPVPLAITYGK